jgi:hypothetical protein
MKFKKQTKILISFLFIIVLILNISFIVGANYRIYSDGVLVHNSSLTQNLYWKIYFQTYGGENNSDGSLPTLTASGCGSACTITIPNTDGIHARWQEANTRCRANWGGPNVNCATQYSDYIWYTFEHVVSQQKSTNKIQANPGTYDFNLIAYGDGPNPPSIEPESLDWDQWNIYSCRAGTPTATANWINADQSLAEWQHEYFESAVGTCNNNLEGDKCPVCKNNPNGCSEYDAYNGYLCNGVYAVIQFFDGATADNFFSHRSDTWGNGHTAYTKNGRDWLTDATPGTVSVNQEIMIVEGDCIKGSECISGKYCDTDNLCKDLPDCKKANPNGYGVLNDLSLDGTTCTDDGIFCTDDVCDGGSCVNNVNNSKCEPWELCNVDPGSGCEQDLCSGCDDCFDFIGGSCNIAQCTNCVRDDDEGNAVSCYHDPRAVDSGMCRNLTDVCDDPGFDSCTNYSVSECLQDPCGVETNFNKGCMLFDGECIEYPDTGTDPYYLGNCTGITNLTSCNNFSLHPGDDFYLCAWDEFNEEQEPDPACLNCADTANACFAYDNEPTCNTDPCYKSVGSCLFFGCNQSVGYDCYWEDNTCKFNGTLPGSETSCSYSANILSSCLEADRMLVEYSGVPASCTSPKVNYPCGQLISLDFFNWMNVMISLFVLVGIYFIVNNRER